MEENQLNGRPVERGHYDKSYMAQLVAEVVGGKSIRAVCEEYGINRSTLRDWVYLQDIRLGNKRLKRPVPIGLKRTVVRSIQSGRISMREAQLTYGIRAEETIKRWIKEIEQENTEIVVQTDELMAKDKSAKGASTDQQADVKALQKALQEAQLKIAALNTLIDVAEEQLKINIRKKPGAKQSND
jgi:transposase